MGMTTTTLQAKSTITTAGITSSAVITTTTLETKSTITAGGTISATSFATTSDARFKQNVTSLSGDRLRNLLNLRGVSFQWRQYQFPERSFENETMFGFIAQDVERYFPEIVRRSSDGWRRIQSGAFEPLLTEGFRLHDERISRLEEENRALQERLAR